MHFLFTVGMKFTLTSISFGAEEERWRGGSPIRLAADVLLWFLVSLPLYPHCANQELLVPATQTSS